MELRILPEVAGDVAGAIAWYEEQAFELGARFYSVFLCYLPGVTNHPELYPEVYAKFRRVLLRPFPYAAYYRVQEDLVVVALVIHTARNPQALREVLRERGG